MEGGGEHPPRTLTLVFVLFVLVQRINVKLNGMWEKSSLFELKVVHIAEVVV